MDQHVARRLSDLTTSFYAHATASFSATRQAPWLGWERLLELCVFVPTHELRVLDLACGNLRFERFLCERFASVRAWAVDNCDELVSTAPCSTKYQHVDLAQSPHDVEAPLCDLSVSFGFMHHLPLLEQRQHVLNVLVEHTRPGGWICVSFWQFAKNPRLRAKARPVEEGEPGDYLLGWQDDAQAQRYCHSFEEEEIDELVASVVPHAAEVARYSADGKTGNLNRYVLLRREVDAEPTKT